MNRKLYKKELALWKAVTKEDIKINRYIPEEMTERKKDLIKEKPKPLNPNLNLNKKKNYLEAEKEVLTNDKLQVNKRMKSKLERGLIRPEDISTTNTVSSAKIAEAQIEYVGAGILDSATKPGWGSKIFRAISPF